MAGCFALPAGLRETLCAAFAAALPGNTVCFAERGVLASLLAGRGMPGGEGDPRWSQLYSSAPMAALALWVGARVIVATTGNAELEHTVPALEAHYLSAVRTELSRFWKDVALLGGRRRTGSMDRGRRAPGAALRTLPNLALLYSLSLAAGFSLLLMGRPDAARAITRHLAAALALTRVPGELPSETFPRGADDLLIDEHWRDVFWLCMALDALLASFADDDMAFDPPRSFPDVPLQPHAVLLAAIPRPDAGPPNTAVPDAVAFCDRPRCRDLLGFLDPLQDGMPPPTVPREVTVRTAYADYMDAGPLAPSTGPAYALYQVSRFCRWLREEAGMSMLGVLAAEELLRDPNTPRATDALSVILRETLLRNPLLREAVRGRRHLLDAVGAMSAAAPAARTAAWEAGDWDALDADLGRLPGDAGQVVLGSLALTRQVRMMLVSPEPFQPGWLGDDEALSSAGASSGDPRGGAWSEDLAGEDSDDAVSQASDGSGPLAADDASFRHEIEAAMLRIWSGSPSFAEATSCAAGIAAGLRMLSARMAAQDLRGNFYLLTFGSASASHAAWLDLVVLRHLGGPAALHSDAATRSFLEDSGQPHHHRAGLLLRGLRRAPLRRPRRIAAQRRNGRLPRRRPGAVGRAGEGAR
ncbi:hypothetical protein DFJ74DRAFT_759853, partial [Hyaloraphidium curvatum]